MWVSRLERYGANLGPDGLGHGVGRGVRLARHRPKNCQTLPGPYISMPRCRRRSAASVFKRAHYK